MVTISGSNQVEQVVSNVQTSVVEQKYQIPESEFRSWAEETLGEMPFAENKITNFVTGLFRPLGVSVPHAVQVENGKKVLLNPLVVQKWLDRNKSVSDSEKLETPVIKDGSLKAEQHKEITKSLVKQFLASQIFKKAFPDGDLKFEYFDRAVDLTSEELTDLANGLSQGGKLAIIIDSKVLEKSNLTRRELIKGMSIPAVVEQEPGYITRMRNVQDAELKAQKAGFFSDFLAGVRNSITGKPVVEETAEEVQETVQV